MYFCYVHNWSSPHAMCPSCITYETSTGSDSRAVVAFKDTQLGSDDTQNELLSLRNKLDLSLKENERLRAIIRQELSENDELGYEYTYVLLVKEENASLREQVMQLTLKNDELLAEKING